MYCTFWHKFLHDFIHLHVLIVLSFQVAHHGTLYCTVWFRFCKFVCTHLLRAEVRLYIEHIHFHICTLLFQYLYIQHNVQILFCFLHIFVSCSARLAFALHCSNMGPFSIFNTVSLLRSKIGRSESSEQPPSFCQFKFLGSLLSDHSLQLLRVTVVLKFISMFDRCAKTLVLCSTSRKNPRYYAGIKQSSLISLRQE